MAKKSKEPVPEALNNEPNAVFVTWEPDGTRKEWPYRRRHLPEQMRNLPIFFAVEGWLQELSLEDVISLWYTAQGRKYERLAKEASQLEELKRRFPEQYGKV